MAAKYYSHWANTASAVATTRYILLLKSDFYCALLCHLFACSLHVQLASPEKSMSQLLKCFNWLYKINSLNTDVSVLSTHEHISGWARPASQSADTNIWDNSIELCVDIVKSTEHSSTVAVHTDEIVVLVLLCSLHSNANHVLGWHCCILMDSRGSLRYLCILHNGGWNAWHHVL